MKLILPLFILVSTISSFSQEIPKKEEQIAAALLAAPAEFRDDATVYGYDIKGNFITLRTGKNNMVCLTDNPNRPGFEVAAYHITLEPFMARGRELRKQGKASLEVLEIREREAKSGKLKMPASGASLHLLYGKDGKFNSQTGEIENAIYRYVVYLPWATTESTGLPVKPTFVGQPWLMNPGTHRAHIMISPPEIVQK